MDFWKHEWDDGNIINGDGWSSTCEMEHWYEWKGGTPTSTDTWSLLYITAILTKSSIPNTYNVAFNTDMNQVEVNLSDFLLTVYSKYDIPFTWSAKYIDNRTLRIAIITNSILVGDEIVSLKFINYKVFRGVNGGWLVSTEIKTNASDNLVNSKETASSLSIFAQYSAYTGIIITVFLIIIGGGSYEMLWALLNSMQIISYLSLMTPYFPQHVRIMFQVLKFSNLNFDYLSNIFQSLLPFDLENIAPYNEVFTMNGIRTPLFIENWASILLSLSAYIGSFLFSVLIYKISWWLKLK